MYRTTEVILVLTVCAFTHSKELTDIEVLSSQPTHCTYEYAFDMYGAHCAGLRLTKLPNLRGGIEILDFSDNKLHEITKDTFSSYSSIKYLYLADNQIYLIEEDAFTYLTYLQTLDLSNNVILDLPNSLFQLPYLRKLYLKGNPLLHKNFKDLSITKPIKAPLELFDLSDCKIQELPNWGNLPQMLFYNISHNPLKKFDVRHFAEMCNLAKVDLTESLEEMNICEFRPIVSWFQAKGVYFQLADYNKLNSQEFAACKVEENFGIYNSTYNRCKAEYLQVQNVKSSRRTWLTIGGGLCGFLIGFILLLYVMHRHNVAQTKKPAEKMRQVKPKDGEMIASASLLSNAA